MENILFWLLVISVGISTFTIRISFIEMHSLFEKVLENSRDIFALLPPSILAALSIPKIIYSGYSGEIKLDIMQISAGMIAAIIAYYTRSIIATLVSGMISLWLIRNIISI